VITQRLTPKPTKEREVLSLSWISPRFFNKRYRSLAMFQVPQLLPRKLAATRFPHWVSSHRSRNTSFGKLSESGRKLSNSQPHCWI